MRRKRRNGRGFSYKKRVADINRIYDEHRRSGLSNVEIWRRYVYPVYFISERTFYNMLKAESKVDVKGVERAVQLWLDFMM